MIATFFGYAIDPAELRRRNGLSMKGATLRELVAVAPALGVALADGRLTDTEAERVNRVVEEQGPFWIELAVWLSLFEAARLSIEHRTAIRFG